MRAENMINQRYILNVRSECVVKLRVPIIIPIYFGWIRVGQSKPNFSNCLL